MIAVELFQADIASHSVQLIRFNINLIAFNHARKVFTMIVINVLYAHHNVFYVVNKIFVNHVPLDII